MMLSIYKVVLLEELFQEVVRFFRLLSTFFRLRYLLLFFIFLRGILKLVRMRGQFFQYPLAHSGSSHVLWGDEPQELIHTFLGSLGWNLLRFSVLAHCSRHLAYHQFSVLGGRAILLAFWLSASFFWRQHFGFYFFVWDLDNMVDFVCVLDLLLGEDGVVIVEIFLVNYLRFEVGVDNLLNYI